MRGNRHKRRRDAGEPPGSGRNPKSECRPRHSSGCETRIRDKSELRRLECSKQRVAGKTIGSAQVFVARAMLKNRRPSGRALLCDGYPWRVSYGGEVRHPTRGASWKLARPSVIRPASGSEEKKEMYGGRTSTPRSLEDIGPGATHNGLLRSPEKMVRDIAPYLPNGCAMRTRQADRSFEYAQGETNIHPPIGKAAPPGYRSACPLDLKRRCATEDRPVGQTALLWRLMETAA